MHVETESRARTSTGPLEYHQVPVRIAERGDGTAVDEFLNTNSLAILIVNTIDRGQFYQDQVAVTHFNFLISEKCPCGLLLQVKILCLLDGHSDSEDSSAFKGSWSLVLLADGITAVIADAQPITR